MNKSPLFIFSWSLGQYTQCRSASQRSAIKSLEIPGLFWGAGQSQIRKKLEFSDFWGEYFHQKTILSTFGFMVRTDPNTPWASKWASDTSKNSRNFEWFCGRSFCTVSSRRGLPQSTTVKGPVWVFTQIQFCPRICCSILSHLEVTFGMEDNFRLLMWGP